MKQKIITSTLAAYVAADLTGWYTTPEKLICCIGLGLAIAAVWVWIKEKKNNHHKKSPRTDQSLGTQK